MKINNEKELTSLVKLIDLLYAGDPSALGRDLMKIIYVLHFLPEDDFPRQDVQYLSNVLYEMAESLGEVENQ